MNLLKKIGRELVCRMLEAQVRKLRKHHSFIVVAVAGSVGKTSTKLAIADLLAQTKRVRYQLGNYNDRVTVPLVFFGHSEPNILNIFAWFKIFNSNAKALRRDFPYDIVVVELGSDGPGQMQEFAYLQPDIAVVTAVAAEHMEYFKTLDVVATEELTVFDFSKQLLVNGDDTDPKYLANRDYKAYSLESTTAQYYAKTAAQGLQSQQLEIVLPNWTLKASVQYLGKQGAKIALAAAGVADMLGIATTDIAAGLSKLQPFSGRMQILKGINDAILIDDTYNASPLATKAALDVLYSVQAPQRIALLGNMNELGEYSEDAHREVGAYCDPNKLDLVITLGGDANKFLALEAEARGCTVKRYTSPYEAGEFIKMNLKKGAVVLAKGSQNGVFAEEALKPLLTDPSEASKLVRQSPYWLGVKGKQFPH